MLPLDKIPLFSGRMVFLEDDRIRSIEHGKAQRPWWVGGVPKAL